MNPAVMETLDGAHRVLDSVIQISERTLERNKAFLKEFEMAYENEDTVVSPASRAKSGEGKQRLDEEIVSGLTRYQLTSFITSYLFLQLNEIEDGIRELK